MTLALFSPVERWVFVFVFVFVVDNQPLVIFPSHLTLPATGLLTTLILHLQ